jgi:uncharacterized surface protein with fasciclin (FAS1) repeats
MNQNSFTQKFKKTSLTMLLILPSLGLSAQTNVFDDIIAPSPNHNYLEAALIQEGLDVALQNGTANYTVFAPDDNAFTSLAAALGTDINGLLALPNLTDILTYHVLGSEVLSTSITNGLTAQPLSMTNNLKLTVFGGNVYVNQATVSAADITADNGVVHVVDGVLLPVQTVVDVALDNGFTSLAAAVVTAGLVPALSDPLGTFTVFAPTNTAFNDLATALGTDINGLLALPNLADVLTYHVLGTEVPSSGITNGAIVQPLSSTNTLKLTLTSTGNVFVNQAQVTLANVNADNGIVHVLDAVVLPVETVVDVALDNGFTSLATAVVTAELLPALTDPLASLTVFAPTNTAFDNLAAALGTDLNGVLAHPQLADILLYHVVGGTVLSTDLTNGPVPTLNGQNVIIDLMGGVKVNDANVTLADVAADNGVVHVIDAVLLPSLAGINEAVQAEMTLSPNPVTELITIKNVDNGNFEIFNTSGQLVKNGNLSENKINVSDLENGNYTIRIMSAERTYTNKFIKQ